MLHKVQVSLVAVSTVLLLASCGADANVAPNGGQPQGNNMRPHMRNGNMNWSGSGARMMRGNMNWNGMPTRGRFGGQMKPHQDGGARPEGEAQFPGNREEHPEGQMQPPMEH